MLSLAPATSLGAVRSIRLTGISDFQSLRISLYQGQGRLGVEVADDGEFAYGGAELFLIDAYDLSESDRLPGASRFLRMSAHSECRRADTAIGPERGDCWLARRGSVRDASRPAAPRRFMASNSASGNAGSRRISPSSLIAAGSVERLASMENVSWPATPPPPPPPPPAAAAAEAAQSGRNADAELVEFFAKGLPVVLLRARHHQARQHSRRRRQVLERFFVAVMQSQDERYRFAAVFLRQQADLDAVEVGELGPGVEVRRRRIERLAGLASPCRPCSP